MVATVAASTCKPPTTSTRWQTSASNAPISPSAGRTGAVETAPGPRATISWCSSPVGTVATDRDTDEVVADLRLAGDTLCVAKGGFHGLGNTRYKSSTNRAPRQTSDGTTGQRRDLQLELRILADVGLLGLPNAGKSTLIRSVSAARPKVADYPFTTLIPNLGVVSVEAHRSFVMADIPGLIEGAAEGQGLGIRFLKHLARSRLLLHLVDILPIDGTDPVDTGRGLVDELRRHDATLADKERWLVLNKVDLLSADELEERCASIVEGLQWRGPVYRVCATSGEGTRQLCGDVMRWIEKLEAEALEAADPSSTDITSELRVDGADPPAAPSTIAGVSEGSVPYAGEPGPGTVGNSDA